MKASEDRPLSYEYHDDAHDAFMTLPPYTHMREGEAPQLGCGPTPCRLGLGVRQCPHTKQ